MFAQKNLTVLSEHYRKLKEESDNSGDDLLEIARKDHDLSGDEIVEKKPNKKKLSKLKKALAETGFGTKMVFDEDGTAKPAFELEPLDEFEKTDIKARKEEFMQRQQLDLMEKDAQDKIKEKAKRKAAKLERKLKGKNKSIEQDEVIHV